MTLGEKWLQELNKKTDKEIIFEVLEQEVEKAIAERKEHVWVSYGVRYQNAHVNEKVLQEFCDINGLKLVQVNMSGWTITPMKE